MPRNLLAAFTFALLATNAHAAIIGSIDATRTDFNAGSVTLTTYPSFSTLRSLIADNGHTLAPAAGTLTPEYLDTVTHLFLGQFSSDFAPSPLSTDEQTALFNWVNQGGVLYLSGENQLFSIANRSALEPFGLTTTKGITQFGGAWENDPANPLLQGVTPATTLNIISGDTFAPGDYTTLATFTDAPGGAVVISKAFGDGLLVAAMDTNFLLDNLITEDSEQFFLNVLNAGPVPTPGTALLLAPALALITRRNP